MNQTASAASSPPQPGAAWLSALAEPWRRLQHYPPLSWLVPHHEVRLLQADGGVSWWLAGQRLPAEVPTPFVAVELPDSLVLRRHLRLPALEEAEVREAVALDARSASPFDVMDLVWGYRTRILSDGQLDVAVVLASRRLIGQHVQALAGQVPAGATPEIWVREGEDIIVLPGFGEGARQAQSTRGPWIGYLLLAPAAMLLVAISVTPTVKLQLQAAQAEFALREAESRTGPLLGQREALTRVNADLEALREQMAEHVDPLMVVDLLTQIIPDDTWLQRLQVQGPKVTLTGQTPNAAALMDTLSRQAAVRDVRAPAPATRAMGGSKENFTIEFSLAPEALRAPAARGSSSLVRGTGTLPVSTATPTTTVAGSTTATVSTATSATTSVSRTTTGTATVTAAPAATPASSVSPASSATTTVATRAAPAPVAAVSSPVQPASAGVAR